MDALVSAQAQDAPHLRLPTGMDALVRAQERDATVLRSPSFQLRNPTPL